MSPPPGLRGAHDPFVRAAVVGLGLGLSLGLGLGIGLGDDRSRDALASGKRLHDRLPVTQAEALKAKTDPQPTESVPVRRLTRILVGWSTYYTLFWITQLGSIAALVLAACGRFPWGRHHATTIAAALLCVTVVMRSEPVFWVVYWFTVRVLRPWWAPLRLRWLAVAVLHNRGGIHSGCAYASISWITLAIVLDFTSPPPSVAHFIPAERALRLLLVALLLATCVGALPVVRVRYHDAFEKSHRYLGWTALAVVWAADATQRAYVAETQSYDAVRVLSSTLFWVEVVISLVIVVPWLFVRSVPVVTEVSPTGENVVLHFGTGAVGPGLFGRIARAPLADWHTFAVCTHSAPNTGLTTPSHIMVISALGDFTRALITDPPTRLYVRLRSVGLPYLFGMFRRVTLLATGAGIGPCLSALLARHGELHGCEMHLVWVAKRPFTTFPAHVVDRVMAHPHLTLWDTAELGRPDLARLVLKAHHDFRGDIVFVISNPAATRKTQEGCCAAGIWAFGATWDS